MMFDSLAAIRFGRLSRLVSANLSIGTGTAFVIGTAMLSLVVDKPVTSSPLGMGWTLRGAIAPSELPTDVPPAHTAREKVPRWT